MKTLSMFARCCMALAFLAPVFARATPFIDLQGKIAEAEAQRTSSLLGKPGLYWFRMSDDDRWIFIPSNTNAGAAATAAVSTMNTLGSYYFWKVPGGFNAGTVNFYIRADLTDPNGSVLERSYNKLRSIDMSHTESPDQFGTAGLSYLSYLSVSLESNRAFASVSTVGNAQQDYIQLSTPEQVAIAVYALSKKKPVSYAKSCAYIFNLQTNKLETVCDSVGWLSAG